MREKAKYPRSSLEAHTHPTGVKNNSTSINTLSMNNPISEIPEERDFDVNKKRRQFENREAMIVENENNNDNETRREILSINITRASQVANISIKSNAMENNDNNGNNSNNQSSKENNHQSNDSLTDGSDEDKYSEREKSPSGTARVLQTPPPVVVDATDED